ncbi:MAG: peptidoglycan bridge formation glycyltransferase FemA/FemB family protein [Bacteroidales bacterium]|nr:peptidoglycan bridge formation glycyltransferase FemA/FemB family protein [Bacteroidales bacterium]
MIDIFQSNDFLQFLNKTGLFETFRFSVSRGEREVGIIQGYIQRDGGRIKQFFSRRAIINGGPYFAEDITDEEIKALLSKCHNGLKKKAIYIETRNFNDYSRFRPLFEACDFIYEPHYDFIVDTESTDVAERNLGKSRKRDIRTSLRDGAEVIENPTHGQIKEFYGLLSNLYTTKVKTPLFPFVFFDKLSQEPFSRFLLVEYQGEIIGGTVCVFDNDTVYEWFACGKDGAFKNIFPSTLATWSGIKYAAESGQSHFDMMGAGAPGDGGYGVREFKAKFGGELVEYGRFKYICNKPLYAIGKLGVKLMKRK